MRMNFKWQTSLLSNLRHVLGAALCVGAACGSSAVADRLPRVVSINTCTDQLVLALADPAQIAGLSRFSRNPEMAYLATQARSFPSLRGTAEEVLRLAPDVVLAGAYSGRATREVLAAHRVRVETFAPPVTIAEARAEIERAARLLGQKVRGHRLVASIDSAVERAELASRSRPTMSALALARRGFVSGPDTLLAAALAVNGLENAARLLGIRSIGQVSLEAIVKLAPYALVVEGTSEAPDQATAFLHHPVLERAFPLRRRIALPVPEITCGGPSLAPLIERIAARSAELPR